MTGLDKIAARIAEGAAAESEGLLAEAAKEVKAIKDKADADVTAKNAAAEKKAKAAYDAYIERAKSSAELKNRTEILRAKQDMIKAVIQKSYDTLNGLDDAAYFDVLKKMLKNYVRQGDGEICFSEKDNKRLPADFMAAAEAIAKEAKGSLTLSKEVRDIANGFVLIYGGIEENCTFKALLDSRKEQLFDIVNKQLFS